MVDKFFVFLIMLSSLSRFTTVVSVDTVITINSIAGKYVVSGYVVSEYVVSEYFDLSNGKIP